MGEFLNRIKKNTEEYHKKLREDLKKEYSTEIDKYKTEIEELSKNGYHEIDKKELVGSSISEECIRVIIAYFSDEGFDTSKTDIRPYSYSNIVIRW